MTRYLPAVFVALFLALVAFRLPSVAQPAGNDQGLYAYVGQAVAHGGVPYRDAWDQKPPAIHLAYAAMYGIWPNDSVVALTDLLIAVGVALLLFALGRRLSGSSGPGELAALLFLLLGNPSFQRLGGIYVRAQCETFIALLATLALLLLASATAERERGDRVPRLLPIAASGFAIGLMFLFKYNAGTYAVAAALTIPLLLSPQAFRSRARSIVAAEAALAGGFIIPVAVVAAWIIASGAFPDLVAATITYNVKYSGDTYRGIFGLLWYLVSFPVVHAAIDSLWMLGGAGCALLLVTSLSDRRRLVAPLWVACSCLSIAVNGSRGLPQYFVQAFPLLALAASLGFFVAWNAFAAVSRLVLVAALAIAVVRVSSFDKLADNTWRDVEYLRGRVTRSAYLGQFASARTSAAAINDLGDFLRQRTTETDRVFVFGFSGGAYVRAGRMSASRFFWSMPILAGFNDGQPGYGATGLLDDLVASRPAVVVLQLHDWPGGTDSATYFLQHPKLGGWLRSGYDLVREDSSYMIWRRRAGA